MNKENYRILQVAEDATDEEIDASYAALKAKYNEERWLPGEEGNNAAKMLDRLEAAYRELTSERKENKQNTNGESAFEEVADLIPTSAMRNGTICNRSSFIRRTG